MWMFEVLIHLLNCFQGDFTHSPLLVQAVTNYHKLGASAHRNLFPHSVGSQSSKSRFQQHQAFSKGVSGEHFLVSSSSWWLPAIHSVPGWTAAELASQPAPAHGPLPSGSVCLQISFPMRTPVFGLRAHPNSIWSHFNLVPSAKTLLLNKVTFTGRWGLGPQHIFWGGHSSTHNKWYMRVPIPSCGDPAMSLYI